MSTHENDPRTESFIPMDATQMELVSKVLTIFKRQATDPEIACEIAVVNGRVTRELGRRRRMRTN